MKSRRATLDLKKDFGLQNQKEMFNVIESRSSWKRKFSLGPPVQNFNMDTLVNGRSIERSSPNYDPLLVFTMDTTVLAAITVQRLVRGHFARRRFRDSRKGRRRRLFMSTSRNSGMC